MTKTASRQRLVAVWFLRVLLGLAFLTIAVAKLTGTVGLATVLSLRRPDLWPALALTVLAGTLAG